MKTHARRTSCVAAVSRKVHIMYVNFMNMKRYCVKCSRISFFYISQGIAATYLKCGGQYGMGFVANFLENTTGKTILKSANICQSYERMYSGTVLRVFFDSLCSLR